ncbi:hypothetical protein FRC09_002534 [Ceratobasidium sp. 395]|nr:hypothetical protein FRC09_002534 [Ceratobasidium sp. 395]
MVSLIDSWEIGGLVSEAAFSPDGARVAVGTDTISIYSVYSKKRLVGRIEGHDDLIRVLVFSLDGRTLASGSNDQTVRLWDTNSGRALFEPLTGHTHWVNSITFSLDSRLVVSGSQDCTVCIWDAHTGEAVGDPIDVGLRVWALCVVPGNRLAVGGAGDDTITVYDMNTHASLFECVEHGGPVRSISCSPDGRLLASGSNGNDCTVRVWDATSGLLVGGPLKGHFLWVTSVVFSPDSRYIASASTDSSIRIWSVETKEMCGEPLAGHKSEVAGIAFTSDGNCLVSGSGDRTVKIWDVRSLGIAANTSFDAQASIEAQPPETEVTSENSPKQVLLQPDVQDCADTMDQLTITSEPEIEITSTTAPEEIVLRLSLRGCADITEQLDFTTCSQRPISSGGFGDIYRGRLKAGTQVAIKTVRLHANSSEQDRKILKHAAHEVYTWSKCKHPNVQPLLGLVMFHGDIGMIAQWESNGSMTQYLERQADADRCALIADGLSYLHASRVVSWTVVVRDTIVADYSHLASDQIQVHGDLKGANVLISQDGVARLADFGNAKLQEYTLKFTKTSTKEALSSRWAAPELFEGKPCSYQTDVYALGMVRLSVHALVII